MYFYLKNHFLSVLLFSICFLNFSCESEPLLGLNDLTENTLIQKRFLLDQSLSSTMQGESNVMLNSSRLYSGILEDGNEAIALINIRSDIMGLHDICNAQIVEELDLIIKTITDITTDDLSIYNISKEFLEISLIKDLNIIDEEIGPQLENLEGVLISDEHLEFSTNEIVIDLFNHDSSIMIDICSSKNVGIKISYSPTDQDVEQFIEFRSSDVEASSFRPLVQMKYVMNEQDTTYVDSYSIIDVAWIQSSTFPEGVIEVPYVIDDIDESQWGMVYAFDFQDIDQIVLPIVHDDLELNSNIINTQMNTPLNFMQIDLQIDPSISSELDSIQFYISNAVAFIGNQDLMGDNWSAVDTTGTENNGELDWIDGNFDGKWNSGEGEEWFDYGLDNCPDSLETGAGGCDVSISEYNPDGSEGNNSLDWIDDGDSIWEEGEGEKWEDIGADGCEDAFETGDDENPCLEEADSNNLGSDPNGDNYLLDPNGDDWDGVDLGLTENNGQWDPGEPFFDWVLDGLPVSLTLLEEDTEGNGQWEPGEPYEDTGMDGLFNVDEPNYNITGTENNNSFDGLGEFDDCGVDNDCNDLDISDNYVIDPNNDNWNAETFAGTEGDKEHNWNDDGDGLWEEGEGERFYDWGLDGISDSQEAFYVSQIQYPELGENLYEYGMENQLSFSVQPNNGITLWISEIIKNGDIISIKFGIQTNTLLKGLQFKLNHFPFEQISNLKEYENSISYHNDNNLFEDITFSNHEVYDGDDLVINFSNELSINLFFQDDDGNSLGNFLENKERNISHDFSHLVLHVDKDNSLIHDNGMILHLGYNKSSDEFSSLSSFYVTTANDSLIIPIGNILRGFQNENYGAFEKLVIKTDDGLYNYSKMIFFNDADNVNHIKNPIIRLMYWE